MFRAKKLLLILCTVQIIKTLSVKQDGGNLGSTWKYEYGVAAEDSIAGTRSRPRNQNDADRIRKDEERLREAEERLRKQAVAHRNVLSNQLRLGKLHFSSEEEINPGQVYSEVLAPFLTWLSQYISFNFTKPEEKEQTTEPVQEKNVPDTGSDSDAIDSDDTMTFVTERSTRPLGRTHKEDSELDSSQTHESSELLYISGTTKVWKGLIVNGDASASSFEANDRYKIDSSRVEHRAETADVANSGSPVNPHKVKDDARITEFTNRLFKKTMKLFDNVEKETNDEQMRTQIKKLGKNYEDKFNEFLRDTSKQTIRTRLGTQKVVLSAIEMSDRILRRLLNFMVADMDGKGTLRHHDDTAKTFKIAIEEVQRKNLDLACKKFGICHSGPVFSGFVADIMSILLKIDSKKFNQTLNVFNKVIKNTNFQGILAKNTETKLKASLKTVHLHKFKPMLVLLKNIISNKNRPLIINNISSRRRIVDSTVALLEIIDILDRKIPSKQSIAWRILRDNLQEFADGKRTDLQEIISAIVEHLMKNLRELNKASRGVISKNLDVILESFH